MEQTSPIPQQPGLSLSGILDSHNSELEFPEEQMIEERPEGWDEESGGVVAKDGFCIECEGKLGSLNRSLCSPPSYDALCRSTSTSPVRQVWRQLL